MIYIALIILLNLFFLGLLACRIGAVVEDWEKKFDLEQSWEIQNFESKK